jgi:hypothetical protein
MNKSIIYSILAIISILIVFVAIAISDGIYDIRSPHPYFVYRINKFTGDVVFLNIDQEKGYTISVEDNVIFLDTKDFLIKMSNLESLKYKESN